MAKIGRNAICPCGSGKKYKRCCLSALELTAATAVGTADAHDEQDLCDCCLDELDHRADRAVELLLNDHIDDAEAIARQLMRDFPQEVEGVDLLAMVHEARGERVRAIELLRQAIEIAHAHPHLDAETRLLMRERLHTLEQGA